MGGGGGGEKGNKLTLNPALRVLQGEAWDGGGNL